jgi:hypothetical protein
MSTQNTNKMQSRGAEQVKVDYSKTAETTQTLKHRAETESARVSDEYIAVMRKLDDRDGFTNATLMEVAKENEMKTAKIAQTLDRLSLFIAKASQHTEQTEKEIASRFNK